MNEADNTRTPGALRDQWLKSGFLQRRVTSEPIEDGPVLSISGRTEPDRSCLFVQAICTPVVIAMVHSDNRGALAISTVLFASGVAVSIFLILAHDRPFTGKIAISPAPLLEVMPDSPTR